MAVVIYSGRSERAERIPVDDAMIIEPLPEEEAKKVEIVRGPNIQPLPIPDAPEQYLKAQISLKTVDNITTDDYSGKRRVLQHALQYSAHEPVLLSSL
ncbi:MAG: hypothetical protein ACLTF6_01320 [Clostridium sp.]